VGFLLQNVSMFKIKDKVINQRGHVGIVIGIRSKGCKHLFKVDFGRVSRFFEAKELSLTDKPSSIELLLKRNND
jgi:hypothetical protein